MKRTPKQKWRKLYSWTRLMFAIQNAGNGPPVEVDERIKRLWHNPGDPLRHKQPGRNILLLNRKRNTIARGLPWHGFNPHREQINCRCVAVPIAVQHMHDNEAPE